MTISARGITHYIENVGEFIKIEQWEKEVSYSNHSNHLNHLNHLDHLFVFYFLFN